MVPCLAVLIRWQLCRDVKDDFTCRRCVVRRARRLTPLQSAHVAEVRL